MQEIDQRSRVFHFADATLAVVFVSNDFSDALTGN